MRKKKDLNCALWSVKYGRRILISGLMLLEKAKDLGNLMNDDFDPSPSWIQHWRERNLIVF